MMSKALARFTEKQVQRAARGLIQACKAEDLPVAGVGIDAAGNIRTFSTDANKVNLDPDQMTWEDYRNARAAGQLS